MPQGVKAVRVSKPLKHVYVIPYRNDHRNRFAIPNHDIRNSSPISRHINLAGGLGSVPNTQNRTPNTAQKKSSVCWPAASASRAEVIRPPGLGNSRSNSSPNASRSRHANL